MKKMILLVALLACSAQAAVIVSPRVVIVKPGVVRPAPAVKPPVVKAPPEPVHPVVPIVVPHVPGQKNCYDHLDKKVECKK